MKKRVIVVLALSLLMLAGLMVVQSSSSAEAGIIPADDSAAETVSQITKTRIISQYGITWTFDTEYEYGQFANGDYWVLGPVTITRIEPDAVVTYYNLGSGICTGGYAGVDKCKAAVSAQYPGYDAWCDGTEVGTGDCIASYVQNGWEVNPGLPGRMAFRWDATAGTWMPGSCLNCRTLLRLRERSRWSKRFPPASPAHVSKSLLCSQSLQNGRPTTAGRCSGPLMLGPESRIIMLPI